MKDHSEEPLAVVPVASEALEASRRPVIDKYDFVRLKISWNDASEETETDSVDTVSDIEGTMIGLASILDMVAVSSARYGAAVLDGCNCFLVLSARSAFRLSFADATEYLAGFLHFVGVFEFADDLRSFVFGHGGEQGDHGVVFLIIDHLQNIFLRLFRLQFLQYIANFIFACRRCGGFQRRQLVFKRIVNLFVLLFVVGQLRLVVLQLV